MLFKIKYYDSNNDEHELIVIESLIAKTHNRLINEGFTRISVTRV